MTSHPTASDLYEVVRMQLPRISLGTVYRNLDQLVEAGEVRRLHTTGRETRFDGDIKKHDHVRCLRCGSVADVHHTPFDFTNAGIHDSNGFEIHGYNLEFTGLCPQCQHVQSEQDSIHSIETKNTKINRGKGRQ